MIDFWIFPLSTIWGAYHTAGFCFFLNMNMCINSDYFRIESTSFRASAVSSLILSNSPAFTRSPFTIQLPPQQMLCIVHIS